MHYLALSLPSWNKIRMRNHNKERPRKKDTSDEPRRTKPRMVPYKREHVHIYDLSDEDKAEMIRNTLGDIDANGY